MKVCTDQHAIVGRVVVSTGDDRLGTLNFATFALAAPVVFWGAWPFHRAAWLNLRHAAASMDTLISLGTLTAFGWSTYALFLGTAGTPGMKMGFTIDLARGAGRNELYLEVATAVTMFILAGRYFEARAKRRSSAALRRPAKAAPRASQMPGCCAKSSIPSSAK